MKKIFLTTALCGLIVFTGSSMENNTNHEASAGKETFNHIITDHVVNAQFKTVKEFKCNNPYVQVGSPTIHNYHYPKANPIVSVWKNIKEIGEQGAYLGLHTYVSQSVSQKLMLGEQLLALKVFNWYSGGNKKEEIVGLHNEINKKDFLFTRIQKQIKRAEDEESKTNLINVLKENRLNKYQLVAKISDEAASYLKQSNDMDFAFNENLIKIIEAHSQQLEVEKDHLQAKMYEEIKQKLNANLLKILQA
ncbi:MAG: hypothetical protein ACOYT8_01615 [Candidatus Dependentiae bacterium]